MRPGDMKTTSQWGELPSLALTNVYKHLHDPQDLRNASATCWHWRNAIFQKRFFQNFKFKLNVKDDRQYMFFMHRLSTLTDELIIVFDILNYYHLKKIGRILYRIANNNHVVGLRFQTNSVGLAIPGESYSDEDLDDIDQFFLKPIKQFLARKRPSVKVLDLGAIECLTYYANDFLKALARPQDLQEITIASIKYDPSHYPILAVEHEFFEKCTSLQVLSLDYDTLNDDILKTLQILPLKKFMICVHGLDKGHPGISEMAWASFSSKFMNIKLILTLIYAYEAVEVLQHTLLRRNMPLTHLRVLFSNSINIEALDLVSLFYQNTLKGIHWVDSAYLDDKRNLKERYLHSGQDPFVLMAWRCKSLEEIVIHGYMIEPYNLVGVARLRGKKLRKLEVSMLGLSPGSSLDKDISEISFQLRRLWHPVASSNIHPALGGIQVSDDVRDEYILKIIRSDLAN